MANLSYFDTHCHIHDSEFSAKYSVNPDDIYKESFDEGVQRMICVGTDALSSKEAVEFVQDHEGCFASVALHPHEAADYSETQLKSQVDDLDKLIEKAKNTPNPVVAIGETGLDYFYHESDDTIGKQKLLLKWHLELAKKHDLPLIFHVRDAFEDFFAILDEFEGIRGVVHSFTSNSAHMKECVSRGLYIGLNGIMTFTKDESQLQAAKAIPSSNLLLETDAPFLTPKPFRGTMCKPKHVVLTAEFLSEIRGEKLDDLVAQTTLNAQQLFKVS